MEIQNFATLQCFTSFGNLEKFHSLNITKIGSINLFIRCKFTFTAKNVVISPNFGQIA